MRSASRWIYVAVGCVVLLFSGLVYAWSVLSGPIAAEFPHWSTAQLSLTFTIVMSFFCLGGLTCGALSARISPRIFLWISALLFLAGFLLTASMRSLPMLYVGFGVVCGLASGFSYNAVLGTVGAWFPDKQGLVSGILLMGFGLSSFLIGKLYQRSEHTSGEVMLKVEHLNAKKERLQDISMEVHAGEIVGLSGLVGAGRTELVRAIFHVDPYESGTITLKGEEISRKATTHEMIEKGVSLIPEDRKRQGLSLILPISQNIVMASLDRLSPRLWIQKKAEKKVIDQYIKELNIITPSSEQKANNLSGGNQQKVVLAKWLCTQADVIIFDEPTRGIDVGAKKEIYSFMDNLTKQGKAIIMISSEMPEIIGMSDRIYVMRDRKIVKELKAEEATQELILSYALEGAREEDEHAEA